MPPQTSAPVPQAPGKFDFMMKDPAKPPGRFGNLLPSLPKPAKIALAVIGVAFILVIFYSLFFGGKTTNAQQLVSLAARAQEIARVSGLAKIGSQDNDTQGLATTTSVVLSSQEAQINSYLKTNGVNVDVKKLASKLDKTTDTKLTTALQNNNYDQTYYTYLKTNLTAYQDELNTTYKLASTKAQIILKDLYTSVSTLLTAPQLK
jgi:hypothetical protein